MTNTIKINNVEISKEELRKVISENPDLLEPVVRGRYFFPKSGEPYYYIDESGDVLFYPNEGSYLDFNDYKEISNQGVYATEDEAIHDRDRRQAIVRCWKWAQENAPFESDWSRESWQYYTFLTRGMNELPFFKSRRDVVDFINANREDLLLIFK
jgi:hypothetical protein